MDGEELEANLKAPAREKRADRINYKKLAQGERREIKTEELVPEPRITVEKTKKQKNMEVYKRKKSAEKIRIIFYLIIIQWSKKREDLEPLSLVYLIEKINDFK